LQELFHEKIQILPQPVLAVAKTQDCLDNPIQ
jgi:hypothetical protein